MKSFHIYHEKLTFSWKAFDGKSFFLLNPNLFMANYGFCMEYFYLQLEFFNLYSKVSIFTRRFRANHVESDDPFRHGVCLRGGRKWSSDHLRGVVLLPTRSKLGNIARQNGKPSGQQCSQNRRYSQHIYFFNEFRCTFNVAKRILKQIINAK